jgi:hypothetical protein
MSVPKSHHFVPRWYLEQFADPSSRILHVYDKVKTEFRKQTASRIMCINQYYRQEWAPFGIEPNILEKTFGSRIEGPAKQAFEKLVKARCDLTPEEGIVVLSYLAFQRSRVPRQARFAEETLRQNIAKTGPPELASGLLDGTIELAEVYRFDFMKATLDISILYFGRMKWRVLEAAYGSSFVTTDSPVSFYNPCFSPTTPGSEAGIGLVGTQVLFPLSPQLMLLMRHPEYEDKPGEIDPLTRLDLPKNEDRSINVTFEPSQLSADAVHTFNACMRDLSDRIIVSHSQETLDKCVNGKTPS